MDVLDHACWTYTVFAGICSTDCTSGAGTGRKRSVVDDADMSTYMVCLLFYCTLVLARYLYSLAKGVCGFRTTALARQPKGQELLQQEMHAKILQSQLVVRGLRPTSLARLLLLSQCLRCSLWSLMQRPELSSLQARAWVERVPHQGRDLLDMRSSTLPGLQCRTEVGPWPSARDASLWEHVGHPHCPSVCRPSSSGLVTSGPLEAPANQRCCSGLVVPTPCAVDHQVLSLALPALRGGDVTAYMFGRFAHLLLQAPALYMTKVQRGWSSTGSVAATPAHLTRYAPCSVCSSCLQVDWFVVTTPPEIAPASVPSHKACGLALPELGTLARIMSLHCCANCSLTSSVSALLIGGWWPDNHKVEPRRAPRLLSRKLVRTQENQAPQDCPSVTYTRPTRMTGRPTTVTQHLQALLDIVARPELAQTSRQPNRPA